MAHSGSEVVEEIYDIKHDAMGQIDVVVSDFKKDIKRAEDQAERDQLLADALQDLEEICKWGVDEINEVAAEHPEEQPAADSAIAYLEDYTHYAEDVVIDKHAAYSDGGSTTTSTTSTTSTTVVGEPPDIAITFPSDGDVFDEPTLTFTGVATPGSQVTVGPYNASMSPNGEWSITLVLTEGRNVARVFATNDFGQSTAEVSVLYVVPTTTTSSTTTTTIPATTTTTVPATTTTTSTTTTTTVPAAIVPTDPPDEGSFQAAFAPLLEGRDGAATTEVGDAVVLAEVVNDPMSGAAAMTASNEAFAMIRPAVPYVLEEPVFSIFAVVEMIGRALTASVRNLLGPAIVTLGYLVVSMVRRRRSVVA